jgi:hypothetical protein
MHLPAPAPWQTSMQPPGSDRETDHLFPLRLTPFEEYMYLDHRAGNSMVFSIRFDVEGQIDHAAIEQAVAQIAADNPLARATIRRRWWGRYEWTLERGVLPRVEWHQAADYQYQLPALDLAVEAGVRVIVVEGTESSRVSIFMHHTVGDGIACIRVIEQLLSSYALATGADPSTIRLLTTDPTRLADRERKRWATYRGWDRVKWRAYEFWKFFSQLPTKLRPRAKAPLPACEQAPDYIDRLITFEETRALRLAAQAEDVNLNELLLCEFFATLAEWNERVGGAHEFRLRDPWYRVSMPTSLRELDDEQTSVTNIVSMTFLNRRHSLITGNAAAFRQSIQAESQEIRIRRRGEVLFDSLAMLRTIPGLLGRTVRLPICLSSGVFTNLGSPMRRLKTRYRWDQRGMLFGNLRMIAIGGIPPLREGTNAVMSACMFGQSLTFSLQMAPRWFTRADAEEFFELFLRRLRKYHTG